MISHYNPSIREVIYFAISERLKIIADPKNKKHLYWAIGDLKNLTNNK